jgi:hypothetical protein
MPDAAYLEVRCERCKTSFAPGTKQCIHCGGAMPAASPGAQGPHAPDAPPALGRIVRIAMIGLVAVTAFARVCFEQR